MACQFTKRIPEIESNLLALYSDSTASDRQQGSEWYPAARKIVQEWSNHYGFHVETVAAVIAAISPQCPWERNLIIADDILADRIPSIGALKRNVSTAQLLLSDNHATGSNRFPTLAERMRWFMPYGPKVNSFAHNLAGADSVVTIDTHAMQAGLADVEARYTLKWGPYECFATAYINAANRLRIAPSTFQAIIWVQWKRLNPPELKRARRQQWAVLGDY